MRAVRLLEEKGADGRYKLELYDAQVPRLHEGEALVQLSAAALNHRDVWMTMGMYPKIKFGTILGSDGCGVVREVHNERDARWKGRTVVINPSLWWGDSQRAPGKDFSILGMPVNGTLAEFIAVPVTHLAEAPKHLTPEQAAAIPLAGGTAYRALVTKGEAAKGDTVLITGIGGGVALFALQFAVCLGCRVAVTSSCDDKLARAKELGAAFGVNYRKKGWDAELRNWVKGSGGFDSCIDGAGGAGLNTVLRMMKAGGRVVSYGATAGSPKPFVMPMIFLPNIELRGSTMFSPDEFRDMMQMVSDKRVVPVVDSVTSLADFSTAFERMRKGSQFGKIVVSLAPKPRL